MSVKYKPVGWNRQKRIYDAVLVALIGVAITLFVVISLIKNPNSTAETLIIRSTSWTAILLLHVILCIGPLARLDPRFLPLLYNRRHLGVTMFFLAFIHASFAVFQFHALGRANPLVSVFTAYRADYDPLGGPGHSIAQFPFEPFGALALIILFFMAATSHDFWLRNLGPSIWKLMHMLVYVAYGALLAHIGYGILQSERSPAYAGAVSTGTVVVIGLHLLAYRKESAIDRAKTGMKRDGFVYACRADAVAESCGKVVRIDSRRIAIFRHQNRIFAMSNVCRHQGGPIGEGRIIDGCVTCPWHGWQYRPDDGCSPPPFAEIVPTYRVQIVDGDVYVHPIPHPLRTTCPGVLAATTTPPNSTPEFYVGYLKRAPRAIARFARTAASVLALFVPVATAIMAAAQSPVDRGEYEFGVSRNFTGTLFEQPLPLLRISNSGGDTRSFPLVGSGKSGLPAFARGHNGQEVKFRGSLIVRDGLAMIEVNDEVSFRAADGAVATPSASRVESLGRVKLTGELVDTKCYFGVMRPAVGKVHRACAVRCLDGGVPPGLLLRLPDGSGQVVLLAGLEGKPLQFDPQWAALTVSAEGPLELHDGVPVLRTAGIEVLQ